MALADSASNGKGKAWIVALFVLCAGILAYGAILSTNTVSNKVVVAGEYLVYALVIWGLFHAFFLRKRGSKINSIAFTAIYLALFVGALVSAQKHKDMQVSQAVSSIQQEMTRVAKAATDSAGIGTRIEREPPQAPVASGEFGVLERFMKEHIDRMVSHHNDYLLELETIGWSRVLDTECIKHDATLFVGRQMVERAKEIVDKYEKKMSQQMVRTRAKIELLTVSTAAKKAMLDGFDRGAKESAKQQEALWRLEKQVVQQVENIFLLLADSKDWVIEDEKLLFSSDDEVDRFNSYLQAIQDLGQQQELLRNSSFADSIKNLETLKNTVQR